MGARSSNTDIEIGTKNNNNSINYAAFASAHDSDNKWISWLAPVFVTANIAVFLVVMYIGRFSFHPLLGASSDTLIKMGALEYDSILNQHQGWRLLSCIWLHAGLLHLLANMLSLIFVGIRLEQQFGFVKIGIIYLLSGFGGSVLSSLFIRNSISVGASGALLGLLGAMLSELITNWTLYSNKKKWNFSNTNRDNSVPPPPSSTALNHSDPSSPLDANKHAIAVAAATAATAAAEATHAAAEVVRFTSNNNNNNNNEAMALDTLVDILFINIVNGLLPHFDIFAHIGGFLTGFLLGFILLPRPHQSKYKARQVVLCTVSLVLQNLLLGYQLHW